MHFSWGWQQLEPHRRVSGSHKKSGGLIAARHWPARQRSPRAQHWPPQLTKPALQGPKAQEPLEHRAEALRKLQDLPQAPQLEMEEREVSQPLAGLPSQLPKPALQVPKAQEPPEHSLSLIHI